MAGGTGFGRIMAWNDFTAIPPISAADTVPLVNGSLLGGGWSLHGVAEGTTIATVDEPGGILACTTDVADEDSIAVSAGVWKPADGGMEFECRVKIPTSVATTRAAMWVGFTETLSVAAPIMPYQVITSTATYNGTGGMVGFAFDSDATSITWRFIAGDGGAALATINSNDSPKTSGTVGTDIGIDAQATITADRWWVFRVEVQPDGQAAGYILDDAAENNTNKELRFVGRTTAALGTGDNFHATIIGETRSAFNEEFEIDYAYASGRRDWSAD